MKHDQPFITICKDRHEDPDHLHYSVYVVNGTELPLSEVHVHSSAYQMVGGKLTTTTPCDKSYQVLEARSYLLLERLDGGALDYTTNYQLSYDNENGHRTIQYFTLPKYLRNLPHLEKVPILNKPGRLAIN